MTLRTETDLLALWERALPLAAPAREACLAAAVADPDDEPPATLGAQRARLLRALAPWCGGRLALTSRCPDCGERLAYDVDPASMARAAATEPPEDGAADDAGPQTLAWHSWRVQFRPIVPGDLDASVAGEAADDPDLFASRLLQRCVLAIECEGAPVDASAANLNWPPALVEALSARLQSLDPLAAIAFDVECPACGHGWSAPFDVAQALWAFVQAAAERLLVEVDALARRYGWSEAEVLALTPVRRSAYLQLAGLA